MTMAELERKIAKMDETQKQIVNRQNQIEEVLSEMNNNIMGIYKELGRYSRDQTVGMGRTRSLINTLSNSTIGIAVVLFLIYYIGNGGPT